jgi:DNA-binding NarL/FixJ family response regulator
MEHFRLTGPVANEELTLLARERQVLGFISRGLRNAEAARQLGLDEATVVSHIKAIYRKLGISSRAEVSWNATRMGLSPGGDVS